MTDTELRRLQAICKVAKVDDIEDVSDGFHTFNDLYEQRMILFAALVKAYKNKSWKSYRHEDGEYCFGGGWFIVGIDTPEGSYTYHYKNEHWDMFDCIDLPRAKHWDGHTEVDAETRLMSLEPSAQPERQWENCFNCPLSHGCPKIKGCTNEQAEQYASEIPDGCPLSIRPKIIRCEDCKHFQNGHICQYFSRFGTIEMKPDDFCSRAERREDEPN